MSELRRRESRAGPLLHVVRRRAHARSARAAVPRTPGARSSAWSAGPRSPATASAPAARGGARAAEAPPEERRQATILFADLSGYTAAAERMDPEAVKALVDRTLRRLGEEIERFGGSIDKFIGDNVMGSSAPRSPTRTTPSGPSAPASRCRTRWRGPTAAARRNTASSFSLRVGHQLRRGDGGRRRRPLHGDGRRRQRRRAAPGRRPAGERHGRRADLPGHRGGDLLRAARAADAQGQGGAGSRPGRPQACSPSRGAGAAAPQTPLIGREEEAGLLASLVERVEREGRPYLVTVIGQAGVGKSRLLRELMTNLESATTRRPSGAGQCPPYGAGIAYWALGGGPQRRVRDPRHATRPTPPGRSSARVSHELMSELGDESAGERNAALLAIPLGLEPPEELAALRGGPAADARGALLRRPRRGRGDRRGASPLVLAIDDIHWADEGMLDLIDHLDALGPRAAAARLPDPRRAARAAPGWGGGRRNATTISLEPLTDGRDAGAGRGAAAEQRERLGEGRPAGRRALGRQPAVRGGDGQPPARGGHRRGRHAAEHGPVAARRPSRFPRAPGAQAAPVRLRDRPDLLGGRARDTAARGGPRPRQDPRDPGGEGPARARATAAGSPANGSTRSSTS